MSNVQAGPGNAGRAPVGRIVAIVVALLAAALVIAVVIGGSRSGTPSSAGDATPPATSLDPSSPASAPGDGSNPLTSSAPASPAISPPASPLPTPTPRPTPAPTPNTKPVIASSEIPLTVDCGGANGPVQIKITWTVKRATGVTIAVDGPGIFDTYPGATGEAMLPFACGPGDAKHTYMLTTTGGSGPAAHITKTVQRIN